MSIKGSTNSYLVHDVCLAQYSSWRIGGTCDYLFYPENFGQLLSFFEQDYGDFIVLGNCTNVLIRDKGIRGGVILTRKINEVKFIDEIYVEAYSGANCTRLATFCAEHNLKGAEFLAGIPGTIGGALKMNAGSFGGQIWEIVEYVKVLIIHPDHSISIEVKKAEDFIINYRKVVLHEDKKYIYLSAVFKLEIGDKEQSLAKIREYLSFRREKQPLDMPSCGSVFKNPPNDHAGRLIEACGLKGRRIGGASVSLKHANFIVNDNHASSEDVENLILEIQSAVHKKFGIILSPEVQILGEK